MKNSFVIAMVLMGTNFAFAEVPVCPNAVPSSEVREDEYCKITSIRGPLAEEKYHSLDAPEVAPRPNTFPQDYLDQAIILAKYSPNLVCWKIQAPIYRLIDGQKHFIGTEPCSRFSCNIIEHKQ